MHRFKVGDKVRLALPDALDLAEGFYRDQKFTVKDVTNHGKYIRVLGYSGYFMSNQLELVDTLEDLIKRMHALGYKVSVELED